MWHGLGAAASSLCTLCLSAQKTPNPSKEPNEDVELIPFRDFEGARFHAVSPDSSRICVYRLRRVQDVLRPWSYDGGEAKRTDDVLQVIDFKAGKTIYATQLRSMVTRAEFFSDGIHLYAETESMWDSESRKGATVRQRVSIDTNTRELTQRLDGEGVEYHPLAWPVILGFSYNRESRVVSLDLAALPGYEETARVSAASSEPQGYGAQGVSPAGFVYGHDTGPAVSADRKLMVYASGHSIICRSTSDLRIVWTQQIEPEYLGAWLLDLSADGSRLAAAIVGGSLAVDQRKFYVGVYNGRDGSVVSRLQLRGRDGMAISPDGKLLAISQPAFNDQPKPTVHIYDISSNRQVGEVTHPPVRGNVRMAGMIASTFTPDGSYLITSGVNDTRVWRIRPLI
jgi:WD40 repeat protein